MDTTNLEIELDIPKGNKPDPEEDTLFGRAFRQASRGANWFYANVWQNQKFEAGLITATTGVFASSLLLGTTFISSPAVLTLAALASLIKTSEIVSKRAESIGIRLKLPPLFIGIALGMITSLPELGVSAAGLLSGMPEIALGNGIGSNIANVGLILGACAIMRPLHLKDKNWWYDAAAMGLSTAFMGGMLAVGHLGMFSGLTMMGMLGTYFVGQHLLNRKRAQSTEAKAAQAAEEAEAQRTHAPEEKVPAVATPLSGSMLKDVLWGGAAVAGLIGSASLLVSGGSALALSAGIAPSLVAMFGFAIGTSLPELMVSMQAVLRGNTGIAVGNILGSNIFNNLFVIGFNNAASAIFGKGIAVPPDFGWSTLMGKLNNVAFGLSAALPIGFMTYNKLRHDGDGMITRKQGVVMAGLYAAFAAASYALGGVPPVDAAVSAGTVAAIPPPPPIAP